MASRFMISVALTWAGASVGVAVAHRGSLDPTVYNVLTVLDRWLPFGTLGRMLCLSACMMFAHASRRRSVILL